MTPEPFNPSRDPEASCPPALARALGSMHRPSGEVPASIKEALVQEARRRVSRPVLLRFPEWVRRPVMVAAAAAIAVLALLSTTVLRAPSNSLRVDRVSGLRDVNGDGRYDVLDAFALAREARRFARFEVRWDLDGDGRLTLEDARAMARDLVRLDRSLAQVEPGPREHGRLASSFVYMDIELVPLRSRGRRGGRQAGPGRRAGIKRTRASARASLGAGARVAGMLCALALLLATPSALPQPSSGPGRFVAVAVRLDSGAELLAAYQVDIRVLTPGARIVGIEGGEAAVFHEPPFYDPIALEKERVVLAAFDLAGLSELPKGDVRVATLHLFVPGGAQPELMVELMAAGSGAGERISAAKSRLQH